MSVNDNYTSLYNFIDTELNNNSYDVTFDLGLFYSDEQNYYEQLTSGLRERRVPTMITDMPGEFLNIPGANTAVHNVGIEFDLYVGNTTRSSVKTAEYQNVDRNTVINAVNEVRSRLLAEYHPLGTPYLYMGGEDSTANAVTDTTTNLKFLYIKFTPKNTDVEGIIRGDSDRNGLLSKNATHINFLVSGALPAISVPYTVNEEIEITITRNGNVWSIKSGTDTDSVETATDLAYQDFEIGYTTGLEAIVKRIVIDDVYAQGIDFVNVPKVDFSTWTSKSEFVNSGDGTLTTNTISNSILWSETGNAIFGFGTMNPASEVRSPDGEDLYQLYSLELTVAISNDVLFGNNFEYYLSTDDGTTYERIHPIDRGHTLAAQMEGEQYINGLHNVFVVSETAREHTLSFYYVPNKKLNKMLKHIVDKSTEQNTSYKLKVQYPFFQVTYDVLIENGGVNPNINTITTFSLTLKEEDTNI
jgi:hypothetical protein